MIQQERMIVVRQKQIADHIFELTLIGQLVRSMKSPGQFVHVRTTDTFEPLLRRPISIASIDHDAMQFTMIYRAEGRGTKLLAEKKPGDEVDVLGPLGNGFPVDELQAGQTALLVGGGIGVPPLYELSKQLGAKGVKTIHVLGFQNTEAVFYEHQFAKLGDTYIATVDGSKGHLGFVTNVLDDLKPNFDVFYSCGPIPMLSALEKLYPTKTGFLSFEERMGCGIGACFACVCHTTAEDERDYIKVCSDGPVFPRGVVSL